MSDTLEIEVAGHTEPILLFDPIAICGNINDGVSLSHGKGHRWQGSWVISFADLQRMYLAAKDARDVPTVRTDGVKPAARVETA